MEEERPSPLTDLPDSLEEWEPFLDERSNEELQEGAETLDDLIECVARLSQLFSESGSFADIIPEDVTNDAKELARFSIRIAMALERLDGVNVELLDSFHETMDSSVGILGVITDHGSEFVNPWRTSDPVGHTFGRYLHESDTMHTSVQSVDRSPTARLSAYYRPTRNNAGGSNHSRRSSISGTRSDRT
jgi:hypothetical protein